MSLLNWAALAKLVWRFLHEEDKLWVQVLLVKYGKERIGFNAICPASGSSFIWKGIVSACPLVVSGVFWSVENGSRVKFWTDSWLGEAPLISVACSTISLQEQNYTVDFYWHEGGWDFVTLANKLPHDVLLMLHAMVLRDDGDAMDKIVWRDSLLGQMTVKGAYRRLRSSLHDQKDVIWPLVWKVRVPQSYRVFLWRIVHGRIMTNEYRARLGMTDCGVCSLCVEGSESILHVLRDCPYAKRVWQSFMSSAAWLDFSTKDLWTWLLANLKGDGGGLFDKGWNVRFASIL